MIAGYAPREMSHIRPARPAPSPAASHGARPGGHAGRMPDKCRTGVGGPSGVGELAHLVGLDDLLVLAAFLGTLGALESVDLLPAGEVDRANAALGQQSVDDSGSRSAAYTATFSGLGQILEHVGRWRAHRTWWSRSGPPGRAWPNRWRTGGRALRRRRPRW